MTRGPLQEMAWALALTLLIQVLSSLIALSVPVLAPSIAAARSWDARLIGYYPGLMYLAALLVSVFGLPALHRVGPILLSLASVAVSAVGLVFMLAPAPLLLGVGALVIGLGYGPVVPATSQVLGAATPPRYANLIFSLKQTGAPLGGLLAGLLVPALLQAGSWRFAVIALAGASLGLAGLLLPFGRRTDHAAARHAAAAAPSDWLRPILALLRLPHLRRMVTASFCYAAMQLCLGTFLTVYLVQRLGLSLPRAGLVFGISQAGSAVGRLLWGYVADRCGAPLLVFILLGVGMAAATVLVVSFTPAWPLWAMALVAAGYGATAMGWNGVLLAEVARLAPPGETRALTGAVMSVNFFGVLVGPLLFTLVLHLTGRFEAGYLFMAAFVLLGTSVAAASLRSAAAARPT